MSFVVTDVPTPVPNQPSAGDPITAADFDNPVNSSAELTDQIAHSPPCISIEGCGPHLGGDASSTVGSFDVDQSGDLDREEAGQFLAAVEHAARHDPSVSSGPGFSSVMAFIAMMRAYVRDSRDDIRLEMDVDLTVETLARQLSGAMNEVSARLQIQAYVTQTVKAVADVVLKVADLYFGVKSALNSPQTTEATAGPPTEATAGASTEASGLPEVGVDAETSAANPSPEQTRRKKTFGELMVDCLGANDLIFDNFIQNLQAARQQVETAGQASQESADNLKSDRESSEGALAEAGGELSELQKNANSLIENGVH